MSTAAKNVYAIGSSRNIGYLTSLGLLEKGATVTFLLRNTSCFDKDTQIQSYVKSGKAYLVNGDAHKKEDVAHGWEQALSHGPVDALIFTVGGIPKISLRHGAVLSPPDLVTQAIYNALITIPASLLEPGKQPRVIAVTSAGLSAESHKALPFAMKPLYGWLLEVPHQDKRSTERILSQAMSLPWTDTQSMPDTPSASEAALKDIPKLSEVLVVRPMWLTDGAETGKYRVVEGVITGYTISRKDVAHYMVRATLADTDEWTREMKGKKMSLAY